MQLRSQGSVRRSSCVAVLVLAIATPACGHPPEKSGTLEYGYGTTIPWNSNLVTLGNGTLGAAVTGLSDVEILRIDNDSVEAAVVEPPPIPSGAPFGCHVRVPVALAAGDVDGQGGMDLVVQDPCGSWVAAPDTDGTFRSVPVPAIENHPAYAHVTLTRAGAQPAMLFSADPVLGILDMTTGRVEIANVSALLPARVTHPFVLSDQEVWVQRSGAMIILQIDATDVSLQVRSQLDQKFEMPYARPFDAYDNLTPLRIDGCTSLAMGIGLFAEEVGPVPQRLQLLRFSDLDSATFQTEEAPLATDWDDVIAFAVTENLASQEPTSRLVGVLGRRRGSHVFQLAEFANCDAWTPLVEAEVDFDIRTPPAPAWHNSPSHVPPTDHVFLQVLVEAPQASFIHYDGYDVRMFRVTNDGGWHFEQAIVPVHAEREDLSLVEED